MIAGRALKDAHGSAGNHLHVALRAKGSEYYLLEVFLRLDAGGRHIRHAAWKVSGNS
jgi:hypothetical protein